MINKVVFSFLILMVLVVPAMAQSGTDAGDFGGTSVLTTPAPVSSPAFTAEIREITPQGKNLSQMIRRSRPYNGLNPTLEVGEEWVKLDQVLNGVSMRWQGGVYSAGYHNGYLEKGDGVIAKPVAETGEYIEYKIKKGRCGNPVQPLYFRKAKPRLCQPVQPVQVIQQRCERTPFAGEDTVLADVTAPTIKYGCYKEAVQAVATGGSIAHARNPGGSNEHVIGGFGWSSSSSPRQRPCPPPPPPPPTSPYCPPTGGAPADPGGSQVFDDPVFVPGLSDQPISP